MDFFFLLGSVTKTFIEKRANYKEQKHEKNKNKRAHDVEACDDCTPPNHQSNMIETKTRGCIMWNLVTLKWGKAEF